MPRKSFDFTCRVDCPEDLLFYMWVEYPESPFESPFILLVGGVPRESLYGCFKSPLMLFAKFPSEKCPESLFNLHLEWSAPRVLVGCLECPLTLQVFIILCKCQPKAPCSFPMLISITQGSKKKTKFAQCATMFICRNLFLKQL